MVRCIKVEFSKAFIKASKRLSGKMLDSLRHMIVEVKEGKAWLGCGALLGKGGTRWIEKTDEVNRCP